MKEKTAKDQRNKKKRIQGFKVVEDECIWMKAGVINFRLCDNVYDCYNCPFDRGMRKAMNLESPTEENEEQPEWAHYLRARFHGASRPCRHALTGRVNAPKICTMNYECYHCSYDQMLDERDIARPIEEPSYKIVSGYEMANGYYYHMGHSWALFEHGGRVRVGFDDFLVKLFGPAQALNLPPLGATLTQNEVGWTFSRDEHKAAVLSPVTGSVLATNHRAMEHPEITNHDPYQAGWLFILEPNLPKRDLKGLYFEVESYLWMEEESQRLMSMMGPEYEQLAATGGQPINDLFGSFPELEWNRLAKTFLRTEEV
ncbi:MAG: glycine cleavage system protein H [Pseudomonadota bacterium]